MGRWQLGFFPFTSPSPFTTPFHTFDCTHNLVESTNLLLGLFVLLAPLTVMNITADSPVKSGAAPSAATADARCQLGAFVRLGRLGLLARLAALAALACFGLLWLLAEKARITSKQ